ncbi:MAG: DUF4384 domain-containing protein [Myxococcales bacterium]|nr:DUF4384 domain-containing protein [Myxococcales bacterium]
MLTHSRGPECVSDLTLDRWLAEEEPTEAQDASAQAHLSSCARCALRLQEMTASREAFLRRQPSWQGLRAAHGGGPAAAPSRSGERDGDRRRRALRWGALGGLAAAALVWIALLPGVPEPLLDGVRTKGRGSIGAYVKRGDHVSRVVDGDVVRPGDRLRFVYSTTEPVHFGLLHHDGVTASIHYPLATDAAVARPGRDVPLGFSVRLDAAGRHERLFGLFCSEPVALEPLRAELERTGQLAPPAGCQVDALALRKGAAP